MATVTPITVQVIVPTAAIEEAVAPVADQLAALAATVAALTARVATLEKGTTQPPPPPDVLPAPANLTATLTANGVLLVWDSVAGADHYELHRSADGSDPDAGDPYAEVPVPPGVFQVSFVDSTAVPGASDVMYRYCPAAVAGDGTVGPCSADVMVSVPAKQPPAAVPAPTMLAATAGNMRVDLSWMAGDGLTSLVACYEPFETPSSAPVDGQVYEVGSLLPDGGSVILDAVATSVTDNSSLDNGSTYTFRVWARAADGRYSTFAEVKATPAQAVTPPPPPVNVDADMQAVMDLASDADFVVAAGETKTLSGTVSFTKGRVDSGGVLQLAPGLNLTCETLINLGTVRAGTKDARIPRSNPITITFSNASGPLVPLESDKLHLRRGYIAMGATTELYGELPALGNGDGPKEVVGWKPLKAIPAGRPDPNDRARAINFRSEVHGPTTGGHVMFMHEQASVAVSGCYFRCGRQDKSVVVTDPVWGKPETYANARGRYPIHAHHCGPDNAEILWEYGVVEDSFGWGFVNHDSRVRSRWNTDVNAYGAGFMVETFGEVTFTDGHISIGSRGYANEVTDDGRGNNDFGTDGAGLWISGGGGGLGAFNDVEIYNQATCAFIQFNNSNGLIPIDRLRNISPDYADVVDALDNRMEKWHWPSYWPVGKFDQVDTPFFVRRMRARFAPDRPNVLSFAALGWFGWAVSNPDYTGCMSLFEDCDFESIMSAYSNNVMYRNVRCVADDLRKYKTAGYSHTGLCWGQKIVDCRFDEHLVGIQCPTLGTAATLNSDNLIEGNTLNTVVGVFITNPGKPELFDNTDPANPVTRQVLIRNNTFPPLPAGVDASKLPFVFNGWELPAGRWYYAYAPWFVWYDVHRYYPLKVTDPWVVNLFHWKVLCGRNDLVQIENPEKPGEMWYLYPNELCEDYRVVDDAGNRILPIVDEVLVRPDGTLRKTSGEIARETPYRLWGTEPLPAVRLPGVYGVVSKTPAVTIEKPLLPKPQAA
jgi:hypothetical protein